MEIYKQMKKQIQAVFIAAGVVASAIAGATGGALLTQSEPEQVVVEVERNVEVLVPYNVTVEKEVEVLKEVLVEDTEFLQLVCERAMFEDLTECKAEITAEDEALKLALSELKSDFAREAFLAELISDDRRVDLVRVYDKFEEVNVSYADFDKDLYEFKVETRLDDTREDVRVNVVYTVEVDNGVARIVNAE